MAEKLDSKQTVGLKELIIANMFDIQAVVQLLMKKGIISEQEYFTELNPLASAFPAACRGVRERNRIGRIHYGEDSPQLAAGSLQTGTDGLPERENQYMTRTEKARLLPNTGTPNCFACSPKN
jgi:hypothetical protein